MSNEYYKNLPKKRMAAGALIFDIRDQILLVKPSYKDHWTLVGGVIEENESPKDALIREVKEEIMVDIIDARLLCVDYMSDRDDKGESIQFVFFGGRLHDKEIKNIKLDGNEISGYKFMRVDEALPLLSEKLRKRLPKCLEALKNDTAFYLENGR